MKVFLKNISLVVAGIIVSFFLVEAIFRISSIFKASKLPKINEKSYRIVCVGDSSTYGLGTKYPNLSSYPTIMQKLFDEKNMSVQVINLGLPGINSSQALNYLKSNVEKLSPDLIIVSIGINDMWNFENSNVFNYYKTKNLLQLFSLKIRKILSNFKIIRFIKLNFVNQNKNNKVFHVPKLNIDTVEKNSVVMPDLNEQIYAIEENLRDNFKKFKLIAENQHCKILFLEYHASGWRNPERIIHSLYKELNLFFVPMYEIFSKLDYENINIRSKDNWHPNEKGYKIMAKTVFEYIQKNNFITDKRLSNNHE